MAYISQKNNRRHRLQFTVRPGLYERYERYLSHAKTNQLVIDFSHDFEEWLLSQLNQVEEELNSLTNKSSWSGTALIDDQKGSSNKSDSFHKLQIQQQGE
jgi:hypothetical protein